MEEWISLNEYMRRFKTGYNEVKRKIHNGELEYDLTEGGHYRIKVGGNTVSKEMYEKEKERRIQAETKLKVLKNILVEEVKENEN